METAHFYRVIAALVLAAVVGVSGDIAGLPRDCHLNQVAPNPRNAHTFYWCLAEGPVLWKCVDDLVFEPQVKKCISKEDRLKLHIGATMALRALGDNKLAEYQDEKFKAPTGMLFQKPFQPSVVVLPAASSTSSSSPYTSVKDYIPYQTPCADTLRYGVDAPTVYLRNPANCSQFYTCSNGAPVMQECPPGLFFNPRLNVSVCDYPRNVPTCSGQRPQQQPSPPRKFPYFQRDQEGETGEGPSSLIQSNAEEANEALNEIVPSHGLKFDSSIPLPEPISLPSPLDSLSPPVISTSPF